MYGICDKFLTRAALAPRNRTVASRGATWPMSWQTSCMGRELPTEVGGVTSARGARFAGASFRRATGFARRGRVGERPPIGRS